MTIGFSGPAIKPGALNGTNINVASNNAIITTAQTKTNLTGSQAWVAASWAEATNQSAIQVILQFDKDVTLYIEQSADGTNPLTGKTYSWTVPANTAISRAVTSIAPYYRISLTNLSSSAATGAMVSAATAIFNVLPESLDHNGNLQIGMPIDHTGLASMNTVQGESRTVSPFRLVGAQMDFNGNAGVVDPNYWQTLVDGGAGTGSVVVSNSLCSINSGTGAATWAKLASIRRARYVSGYTNRLRSNFRLSTNQATNTKRWGVGMFSNYKFTINAATAAVGDVYSNNSQLFTVLQPCAGGTTLYCRGTGAPTVSNLVRVAGAGTNPIVVSAVVADWTISDGAFFQMDGSTFTCEIYKNGTPTHITSFNGHLGTNTYMPNGDIHTFEIQYTNTKVIFLVDGELLHTFSATFTGWSATMDLYIYGENINSGNTTNTVLGMRNSAIHRLGPEVTQPLNYRFPSGQTAGVVLKYSAGNLRGITVNTASNTAVVTLYDGRSNLGKIIDSWTYSPTSVLPSHYPMYNLPFSDGLCLEVKTANASVTVFYE